MSAQHGSNGQPYARPVANSQNQWGLPAGQPTQPPQTQPPPMQGGYPQGYGNGGYGTPAANPAAQSLPYGVQSPYGTTDYGYTQQAPSPYASGHANAGYAPQFEPYTPAPLNAARAQPAPTFQPVPTYAPQQQAYGGAPTYAPASNTGWPSPQDSRGFDLGAYLPPGSGAGTTAQADPALPQNDWNQGGGYHGGYQTGGYQNESDAYGQADGGPSLGFGQPAGGELDQGYGEEETNEYESDVPARSRFPMKIAAVLVGAVVVGSGLMYGYNKILGGSPAGEPPVVKSASAPSKVKPEDGGGKQFAHTDSKIMGRLGDGGAAGASGEAASDVDANGTRKVATLVVGRDGTIQAPAAAPAGGGGVEVPGMTVVDGLGAQHAPAAAATMAAVNAPARAEPAAPAKIVVTPPQRPPVTIAKVEQAPAVQDQTASIEPAAEAPAAPAAPPKLSKKAKAAAAKAAAAAAAAAAPAPAEAVPAATSNSVATTGNGANGFVAVLASVPRSGTSRMDALKRFADMQQKYASVLQGKTPDVAEANLGTKGAYHRLVVGPPGSREQASDVCAQLKSQGYADCWVTAY